MSAICEATIGQCALADPKDVTWRWHHIASYNLKCELIKSSLIFGNTYEPSLGYWLTPFNSAPPPTSKDTAAAGMALTWNPYYMRHNSCTYSYRSNIIWPDIVLQPLLTSVNKQAAVRQASTAAAAARQFTWFTEFKHDARLPLWSRLTTCKREWIKPPHCTQSFHWKE